MPVTNGPLAIIQRCCQQPSLQLADLRSPPADQPTSQSSHPPNGHQQPVAPPTVLRSHQNHHNNRKHGTAGYFFRLYHVFFSFFLHPPSGVRPFSQKHGMGRHLLILYHVISPSGRRASQKTMVQMTLFFSCTMYFSFSASSPNPDSGLYSKNHGIHGHFRRVYHVFA